VYSQRLLRNILPASTLWQSFRVGTEFYSSDDTLRHLGEIFETELDPAMSGKPELPDAIVKMLDKPLAIEALGGMLFYLKTLSLDKDLISQKNFNVYDPIREGRNLVLDGQTLGHMEVRTVRAVRREADRVRSWSIMRVEWRARSWSSFNDVKRLSVDFIDSAGHVANRKTRQTTVPHLAHFATARRQGNKRQVSSIGRRIMSRLMISLDSTPSMILWIIPASADSSASSRSRYPISRWARQTEWDECADRDRQRIISRIHAGSVKESDFNKVMTVCDPLNQ